jgi:hypothetical protein
MLHNQKSRYPKEVNVTSVTFASQVGSGDFEKKNQDEEY